jgi:Arc/MetJ-type ribon-helix-helix transcriptional regulator
MEAMRERAISVRLDGETQRALELLTSNGRSTSEAVRDALVAAARTRLLDQVREETRLIAADEGDRREKAEILALMESLRGEG